MSRASELDRVDAAEITPAKFQSEYLARSRPVVIAGGAAKWRAHQLWTVDYLKTALGKKPVVVNHNPTGIFALNATTEPRGMSFVEAADTIASRTDGAYYVQQQPLHVHFPELLSDVPRPELLDAGDQYSAHLWFGSVGCISPLHFDRADNFLAQIMGSKRVTLFSPEETARLYPDEKDSPHASRVNVFDPDLAAFPAYAEAAERRLVASLEPSDILFIPKGWWHAVETLSTSVSVNFWWISAAQHAQIQRAINAAKCSWAELVTTDVAAAKAFYGALLGWTFRESAGANGSATVTCEVSDGPVAVLRGRADGNALPQWVPYVNVDDVDGAVERARAHGGRVVEEASGEDRRHAVVADPSGAATGLVKRPLPDRVPEGPGTIHIIDLLATQPDQEKFYVDTLGWAATKIPASPKGPYTLLAKSGFVFGGMMQSPPQLEGRTHWAPYFRVADCEASVAKACELGAKIVVPTTFVPGAMIRFAVMTDPQGALFATLQAVR